MTVILCLVSYFIFLNVLSFALMGIDKRKAIKGAFRIPEATLFIVAFIGGSIGSLTGMYAFRHKTRHPSFVYGMPAILVIQIILAALLVFYAPIEFITM